jgi:hypothetical protein
MTITKPNLFIPGAGKSGTSSLHELLNCHPEISMSTIKEPHFWTSPNFNSFEEEDIEKYNTIFSSSEQILYRGESSTGYMLFPDFIKRIKNNYEKEPKFIFLLRNPIDRCYSHYWWLKGMGSEPLNVKDAVLEDLDIEPSHSTKLPESNYKSYYQFGLYAKWIIRFYENFQKENIKIVTTEQLKNDTLETLNNCFKFLDLEPLQVLPEITYNKTALLKYPSLYKYAKLITYNKLPIPQIIKDGFPNKGKLFIRKHLMNTVIKHTKTDKEYPKMALEDRQWLKELYQEDVIQLKQLTSMPFNEWNDFL